MALNKDCIKLSRKEEEKLLPKAIEWLRTGKGEENHNALQALINSVRPMIQLTARNLCKNSNRQDIINDAVNEGIIKILNYLKNNRYKKEKSKFSTFASICSRSAIMDYIHKEISKNRNVYPVDSSTSKILGRLNRESDNPHISMYSEEKPRIDIESILNQIKDERKRNIVRDIYVNGMTYTELAIQQNVPNRTIRKITYQELDKLKTLLSKDEKYKCLTQK